MYQYQSRLPTFFTFPPKSYYILGMVILHSKIPHILCFWMKYARYGNIIVYYRKEYWVSMYLLPLEEQIPRLLLMIVDSPDNNILHHQW